MWWTTLAFAAPLTTLEAMFADAHHIRFVEEAVSADEPPTQSEVLAIDCSALTTDKEGKRSLTFQLHGEEPERFVLTEQGLELASTGGLWLPASLEPGTRYEGLGGQCEILALDDGLFASRCTNGESTVTTAYHPTLGFVGQTRRIRGSRLSVDKTTVTLFLLGHDEVFHDLKRSPIPAPHVDESLAGSYGEGWSSITLEADGTFLAWMAANHYLSIVGGSWQRVGDDVWLETNLKERPTYTFQPSPGKSGASTQLEIVGTFADQHAFDVVSVTGVYEDGHEELVEPNQALARRSSPLKSVILQLSDLPPTVYELPPSTEGGRITVLVDGAAAMLQSMHPPAFVHSRLRIVDDGLANPNDPSQVTKRVIPGERARAVPATSEEQVEPPPERRRRRRRIDKDFR